MGLVLDRLSLLKKIFFCVTFSTSAHALYFGNPSAPEMPEDGFFISPECWIGVKTGYQGDYVLSRSMLVRSSGTEATHTISSFSSQYNAGSVALDFGNRWDIYGSIGAYKLGLSQRVSSDTSIHFTSENQLGGLLGIRTVAACWGEIQLGFDAKAFYSHPNLDCITVNGNKISTKGYVSDRQWQLGCGLSRRVSWFVPYIGFTYSHDRTKFGNLKTLATYFPNNTLRLINKYSFGFAIGFGVGLQKDFSCNVEARIVEETGIGCSADFRF
ncbi:MAG: hypothetical protein FJZ57_06315 [Chlamydiae bacterium]|nr:hypothetical protein [Chlamydiota bacterium]